MFWQEAGDDASKLARGFGRSAELFITCSRLQIAQQKVNAVHRSRFEMEFEAICNVNQREHVALDGPPVPGFGIDENLRGPQIQAGEVDVKDRTVAQLQVVTPFRCLDRRLAGLCRVTFLERGAEIVEGGAQHRNGRLRHRAGLHFIPRGGHCG